MANWEDELTPSMVPEGICQTIAEEIGADNLLKLAQLIGGTSTYLPRKEAILRPLRDQKIREEYNGYNITELAKKYDITKEWIRVILSRE